MKKFYFFLLTAVMAVFATSANADDLKSYEPDVQYTSIEELQKAGTFAIANIAEGKVLYGSGAQNLGYSTYQDAFKATNSGYLWRLNADAGNGNYYLQLVTPTGSDYNCWGMGGVLNSQGEPQGYACSFILGLNGAQKGQDIANGAVYTLTYDASAKGWSILNVGTGKYQGHNAGAATSESPIYFQFCSLKEKSIENPIKPGTYSAAEPKVFNDYKADGKGVTLSWTKGLDLSDYKYLVITLSQNTMDAAGGMVTLTSKNQDGEVRVAGDDYGVSFQNMWFGSWNHQFTCPIDLEKLRAEKMFDIRNVYSLNVNDNGAIISNIYATNVETKTINRWGNPNDEGTFRNVADGLEAGSLHSICLPYTAAYAGVTVYEVAGKEKGNVVLKPIKGLMEAGKGYMYAVNAPLNPESGDAKVRAFFYQASTTTVEAPAQKGTMIGSFKYVLSLPSEAQVFNGYAFVAPKDGINANEAYLNSDALEDVESEEGDLLFPYLSDDKDADFPDNYEDYTAYIQNANLANTTGWNVTNASYVTNLIAAMNQDDVEINQTINLPAGQYAAYAYAFEAAGMNGEDEMANIQAGRFTHNSYMYVTTPGNAYNKILNNMWDGATPYKYDEAGEINEGYIRFLDPETNTYLYTPMDNGVAVWLENGEYRNEIVFNLESDADVTLGIKKDGAFVCTNHGGNKGSYVAKEQGYANAEDVTDIDIDGGDFYAAASKATGSNGPKYYNSGESLRLYPGNTLTVKALAGKVAVIKFTYGKSDGTNTITANCGTIKGDTWTGDASEVVFTIGTDKDGKVKGHRRIAAIEVSSGNGRVEDTLVMGHWRLIRLGDAQSEATIQYVHEPELAFVQEETEGDELSKVVIKPIAQTIDIVTTGDGSYGNFVNRRSDYDALVWPYMGDFIGSESKIALDVKDAKGKVVGQARLVYNWDKSTAVTVQVVNIGENEYGQKVATPTSITQPSDYTVVIPAEFFAVYDNDGCKFIYDEDITVKYHVAAPAITGTDLTAADFYNWTAADATGEKVAQAGCAYDLNVSTGMPYGDGNVYYLNYADLSAYTSLIIVATEGEPRALFNRTVDQGTVGVEVPRDKDTYETVVDNGDGSKTYTIDLAKIVADQGFAHLHAIKGAYWQNTTVTAIKVNGKAPASDNNTTGIEALENGSLKNGKYIQNGKIVIVKNGKTFNVTGVRIK